jgi:large subunit ribosomal protein L24
MPARIKRGDTVVVLSGKDRGKRGQVRQVLNAKERVVVEGVNIVKKHQRARQAGQQSQIVEREAPIHWSNVMLVDPNSDEPTRVAYRKREDGSWVRVGKRSGEDID